MIKLMIADDHKLFREGIKLILEKEEDIKVIAEAIDGNDAVNKAMKYNPNIILMDINMPIINGFETSKLIREKGITTPIIAVTAFDKQDIEEKIIEAQIDEVIVKPFEGYKLFTTIKRLSK